MLGLFNQLSVTNPHLLRLTKFVQINIKKKKSRVNDHDIPIICKIINTSFFLNIFFFYII